MKNATNSIGFKILKKYFLIGVGFISLVLGVIGVFIPLLPTTPFLLLSSYCFFRSSSRLYEWLIHHKWMGPYIADYLKYRAIPKKSKIIIYLFLWGSLFLSGIIVSKIWVTVFLIFIGMGVSAFIYRIKTLN